MPNAEHPPRLKHYIPTLDGWRALAVICVILYHGRSGLFGRAPVLARLAAHGFLGVDLFFAISGFLICHLLLAERRATGTIRLGRFYLRRCFRILPPYYATLIGLSALSLFGIVRLNLSDLPSCLLFYRNYKPLGIDAQGGFYTAHFWTLAVEEHFYLLWPVLLLKLKPARAGKTACLLAMAIFAWRLLDGHMRLLPRILLPANLLARTDTRIDALLWGCIAAVYLPDLARYAARVRFQQLWLPTMAILFAVEAAHVPALTCWQAVLLPALVLSTVLQPGSWLSRVLEWRPLRWLGTISYSLYLWQELFLPSAAEKA